MIISDTPKEVVSLPDLCGQATPCTSLAQSEGDGAIQTYPNEFLEKVQSLRFTLEYDPLACDAKWTMFVAAALSYRYDSKLKPFPPQFVTEQDGDDIDGLLNVINDTPKLGVVLQHMFDENYDEINPEVLDLLYYVLVVASEPSLRLVDDDEFGCLLKALGDDNDQDLRPTNVFEVCRPMRTKSDADFHEKTVKGQSEFAFHGNKLDAFYSIIQNGFTESQMCRQHFLTKSFCTALSYSPNDPGWGASECGPLISCVAICEYINQSLDNDTETLDIIPPYSGFIARVRYLLFYGCHFPHDESRELGTNIESSNSKDTKNNTNLFNSNNNTKGSSRKANWFERYRYCLSLLGYTILLASIGVANNGTHHYWKGLIYKGAHTVSDFCKRIFAVD